MSILEEASAPLDQAPPTSSIAQEVTARSAPSRKNRRKPLLNPIRVSPSIEKSPVKEAPLEETSGTALVVEESCKEDLESPLPQATETTETELIEAIPVVPEVIVEEVEVAEPILIVEEEPASPPPSVIEEEKKLELEPKQPEEVSLLPSTSTEHETCIVEEQQPVLQQPKEPEQIVVIDSTPIQEEEETMQPYSSQQQSSSYGQPSPYSSQMGHQGQQTMQQLSGSMTNTLERIRDWLQKCIQNSADTLRQYVQQYPPLAAFLFTFLALAAVPVAVYTIFGLVTSAIFLTIAFIGFSLVEGFVLMSSGAILLCVLGGIGLFTTVGFAVMSAVYISYRGGCAIMSNVWQGSGPITGQLREAAQRVSSSMQQQGTTGPSTYGSSTFQSGSPMSASTTGSPAS